jgi:hypothetical protein
MGHPSVLGRLRRTGNSNDNCKSRSFDSGGKRAAFAQDDTSIYARHDASIYAQDDTLWAAKVPSLRMTLFMGDTSIGNAAGETKAKAKARAGPPPAAKDDKLSEG